MQQSQVRLVLDREFEREIAKQLGSGRRPDDLVAVVCKRTGLKWEAAKAEVLRVESWHRDEIQRKRRLVILAIWFPMFLGSTVVILANVWLLLAEPRVFLVETLEHPGRCLVLGTALLVLGGGVVSFFRGSLYPKDADPESDGDTRP